MLGASVVIQQNNTWESETMVLSFNDHSRVSVAQWRVRHLAAASHWLAHAQIVLDFDSVKCTFCSITLISKLVGPVQLFFLEFLHILLCLLKMLLCVFMCVSWQQKSMWLLCCERRSCTDQSSLTQCSCDVRCRNATSACTARSMTSSDACSAPWWRPWMTRWVVSSALWRAVNTSTIRSSSSRPTYVSSV